MSVFRMATLSRHIFSNCPCSGHQLGFSNSTIFPGNRRAYKVGVLSFENHNFLAIFICNSSLIKIACNCKHPLQGALKLSFSDEVFDLFQSKKNYAYLTACQSPKALYCLGASHVKQFQSFSLYQHENASAMPPYNSISSKRIEKQIWGSLLGLRPAEIARVFSTTRSYTLCGIARIGKIKPIFPSLSCAPWCRLYGRLCNRPLDHRPSLYSRKYCAYLRHE